MPDQQPAEQPAAVVGLSLTFNNPKVQATPPSRVRRLSDGATTTEKEWSGLPLDDIATKVFSSIQFNAAECIVNDQTYSIIQDDQVRGGLYRLFGPRLSISQLERNISSLEQSRWGWMEGCESTSIDLTRDVAHQRIADLCLLALSSLSPNIISAVSAVLSTLADSLQTETSNIQRHLIEINLYCRADKSLVLINSRLDVQQRGRKMMLICCGYSGLRLVLSLQIRRIAFTQQFRDLLQNESPLLEGRIIDGVVLLPPAPGRPSTRSATC